MQAWVSKFKETQVSVDNPELRAEWQSNPFWTTLKGPRAHIKWHRDLVTMETASTDW